MQTRDALLVGRELDNVRAALNSCLEQGEAEIGLQIAVGMWTPWYFRSLYAEGRAAYAALLALPNAATAPTRPTAIVAAAHLAYCQGDLDATRELPVAVAVLREHGQDRGLAAGLHVLGLIAFRAGDNDAAEQYFGESVTISQRLGDAWWPWREAGSRGYTCNGVSTRWRSRCQQSCCTTTRRLATPGAWPGRQATLVDWRRVGASWN